jgi:hypothetical protein
MGVSLPYPIQTEIEGSLGSIGPVTVAGIPSTFTIDIGKLPQIDLKLEPITLNPVTLNPVTLDLKPVDLNLSIKSIPNIRAHIPANFSVGLSLLGMELMCIRLCGEAQMITEPYVPNPCEVCSEPPEPQIRRVGASAVVPLHG